MQPFTSNADQEHDPILAQKNAINRLEPINRVLRAHRKLWLAQEPREPPRPSEWLLFAASVAPMLVGMALWLIFGGIAWAYAGVAVTALAMIWLTRIAWVHIRRDRNDLARGDDDLTLSERAAHSIAALRDDLRSFHPHDLGSVILGRERRHAKKTGFLSAMAVERWLPLTIMFVTVIPTVLSLISQPLKDALSNFLPLQSILVPIFGVVIGVVLMFMFLPSAVMLTTGQK